MMVGGIQVIFAYIADEELFVTGRKKDVIIKAGRNLYPSELEELTSQVPDIRRGCVIAFGTIDAERGTEKLIIVAETRLRNPKMPRYRQPSHRKNLERFRCRS